MTQDDSAPPTPTGTPNPAPASDITEAPVSYWTPPRMLAGLVMALVAMGVVAYVNWDEVDRLLNPPSPRGSGQRFAFNNLTDATFDMTDLRLPEEGIRSGGPRKDGIPALTDPKTAPVGQAGFMLADDRVVGVTVNGESRAYPIKVLNYHECYNDVLGGVPIAVIFCPLCDSVSVVDRRLGDKVYEFGISGMLYNSNVLLYDRTDDALWSQVGLKAVSGPNAGKSLTHLGGWEITTFAGWSAAQPDSTVATIDTGYYSPERYEGVAYASYFQTDQLMFPVDPIDERFANKFPVVGVVVGETAKAYPVDQITGAPDGRIEDMIEGQRVVLESVGGSGAVRISEVPADAKALHTFWFAWYAFHPGTQVYDGTME